LNLIQSCKTVINKMFNIHIYQNKVKLFQKIKNRKQTYLEQHKKKKSIHLSFQLTHKKSEIRSM